MLIYLLYWGKSQYVAKSCLMEVSLNFVILAESFLDENQRKKEKKTNSFTANRDQICECKVRIHTTNQNVVPAQI